MGSKENAKLAYEWSNYKIIRDRELGFPSKLGDQDDLQRKIYSNFDGDVTHVPVTDGGIFNLEFSLDGRLLIAACEVDSVLIFDAANQKCVQKIEKAHSNCVNCVRYINDQSFATCSDDGTIKMWDTRNLSKCKSTFCGHSNWVKNIEYSASDNMMVTSAFDGSIFAWDLEDNGFEVNYFYERVFVMDGLMRTKLTADGSKMVIATTTGFLMIIHDLNLKTMFSDMKTFRPNLYRLMQRSEQAFPAATMYNFLFNPQRKRNRIEFIDDFPNDAEIICSIQIHPQGWNVLSRNICPDDSHEWTCVHDIQMRDPDEYKFITTEETALPTDGSEDEGGTADGYRVSDIWVGSMPNEAFNVDRNFGDVTDFASRGAHLGVITSGLLRSDFFDRYFRRRKDDRYKIMKNVRRLTHFVEEINCCGKGYIKELCYSTDGRLICSPYGRGLRLLAFNEQLQEVCYCVPESPQKLFTVATYKDYHSNGALCCKFNPKHHQLVTGCLGGEIVWYRPII